MNKLHPIIFFEAHADPLQYNLIISSLDKLIDKGYKTICLELYQGTDLKQLIKGLSSVKKDFINSHSIGELALREGYAKLYDFLKIIKNKGIKLKFVDPVPHEQQTNLENVYKLQSMRDKGMSEAFVKAIEEDNGGVIGLFGFMHQEMITLIKDRLVNKQLYDVYKPIYIVGRSTDSWVKQFYQQDKTTAIEWLSKYIEDFYNLTPKSFITEVNFIETKVHPYEGDEGHFETIIETVNNMGQCYGADNQCDKDSI